jgi:uncharacterized protein (TIGR02466 family)
MINVEPINLWPSLIYKSHYPGNLEKISDKLMEYFDGENSHNLEKGGGRSTYSTVNNLITDPVCAELKEWLQQQSQAVWKLSNFVDRPRRVHRSWINLHPPGAWTDEHDHAMCHQNIVVYLKQPELGGNIMFKDPLQYTFSGFPKHNKNDWTILEVKQNDVIFFPGFLYHKTEINSSQENRLVMTLTISVDIFANE